jgi:hypothetical protein
MSEREDYDRLTKQLGDEADRLEHQSERLEEEISDVREDWKHKRADDRVPGAPPPPPDDDDENEDKDEEQDEG